MTTQLNALIVQQRQLELACRAEHARLTLPERPTGHLHLKDGTPLAVRQLGPSDREGLAALFARLSPESRRRRFLGPKIELTPAELTFFTGVDHVHHEAIAAVDQRDGRLVGVSRYVAYGDQPGCAELAVEVIDDLQRLGLGGQLSSRTVQLARTNGYTLLTATTLWENRPARRLLRSLGFRVVSADGNELDYARTFATSDPTPSVIGEPLSTVAAPAPSPEVHATICQEEPCASRSR